ncbi:Laccase [Psidium guajava]|nr:Laccase [Psidium guajava]
MQLALWHGVGARDLDPIFLREPLHLLGIHGLHDYDLGLSRQCVGFNLQWVEVLSCELDFHLLTLPASMRAFFHTFFRMIFAFTLDATLAIGRQFSMLMVFYQLNERDTPEG